MSKEQEVERLRMTIAKSGASISGARAILAENIVIPRSELPRVVENGDYVNCGGVMASTTDPVVALRGYGTAYLAIAEHIESAQSAETVAAEKLAKRRDELANELIMRNEHRVDGGTWKYANSTPLVTYAVDRIIDLESAK